MSARQPLECVFATDDNYVQHLGAALASLFESNCSHSLSIRVIYNTLSESSAAHIKNMCAGRKDTVLTFHYFDASPYQHFRLDNHITVESYFRLFLTEIIPADVDRIIYLDVDMLILSDLAPIWNEPLGERLMAAVPNLFSRNSERLALPAGTVYFNAGVLVIDLAGWRRERLLPRFLSYVERKSAILEYHDQDVLNAVLQGRVKLLSYVWNFQARTRHRHVRQLGVTRAEFKSMRTSPRIVHFTTSRKPWFYAHDVPFESLYLHYISKSPWRDFRQPDRTMLAVLKRPLWRRTEGLRTRLRNWRRRHSRIGEQ